MLKVEGYKRELTSQMSIFGFENSPEKKKRMIGEVVEISSSIAAAFLLPRHYSGRLPSISKAFGWYVGGGTEGNMHVWKTGHSNYLQLPVWRTICRKCLRTEPALPGGRFS